MGVETPAFHPSDKDPSLGAPASLRIELFRCGKPRPTRRVFKGLHRSNVRVIIIPRNTAVPAYRLATTRPVAQASILLLLIVSQDKRLCAIHRAPIAMSGPSDWVIAAE